MVFRENLIKPRERNRRNEGVLKAGVSKTNPAIPDPKNSAARCQGGEKMKTSMSRPASRVIRLALAAALTASASVAAQNPAALSPDQVTRIDAAISAFQSKMGIPAVTVAFVQDGLIRFQRGYGTADLENSVAATASTVYRIASVTKSLTAVAALQLAEKGKLDLDAPIQKYVPSFPVKSHPITTRHLLGHTSGIRNYKRGEGERTDHWDSLTDAVTIFKDDPLDFEPGTRYGYTTFGYTLLGAVIEGAAGMSFMDYLGQNILKPAGMQHTQADDVRAIVPNRARGYSPKIYGRFDGSVRNASLMDSSYKLPGGGLLSTAEDLARFAIALQKGGLIGPKTVAEMSRNQVTADGKEAGYGYGWYVGTREGRQPDGSIWHGGVQPGFTSDLWILPAKRFALVILTNLEGGGRLGLAALANQIAEAVLR
jgi:serine beta-lactamase-like protein LACTB